LHERAFGHRLKFLNVIDECGRLCPEIRVGRRWMAKEVAVLEELTSLYPAPTFTRSDNGPEFMAEAVRNWCVASSTTSTVYIASGSPWEKGIAETLKGGLHNRPLNNEWFTKAPEGQILADRWRWGYKPLRPHSARPGVTPLAAPQNEEAA
jgi:transposase InsO family protein